MFKNLRIGYRLAISYAIIILLAFFISMVALTGLSNANDRLHNFIDQPFAADTAVKTCRIETNIAARNIREMLIDRNRANYPSYRQKVETSIAEINRNLAILKQSYGVDDGLPAKYEASLIDWVAIGNNIMDELDKGNDTLATEMLLTQCNPALSNLVGISEQITLITDEMQNKALNDSMNSTNIVSIFILGLLAIAFVASVITGTSTTRGIIRPIVEVENAAKQLSNGILDIEITYQSKDQVGQMAQSMRESLKTLATYIHDIDNAMVTMSHGDFNLPQPTLPFVGEFVSIERSFIDFSVKMSNVLRTINQTADELASDSQSVSSTAQLLAQGATEQAAAVEELSSTINEISSQISQNAENTNLAQRNTQEAAVCVQDSNTQMQQMIAAMNDINDKSAEIGKIIKTIDDIAFQTNILALNAAVEAARAGAAGKGFAVVADEVRNLAGKSAEAAKTTASLIEETISAVERGTQMADGASSSITRVVDAASKVSHRIEEIANTSSGQANAIRQVTGGVDQISSVVQQNSANAEESAASSEELSGRAQILKDLISRFILLRDTTTV